MRDDSYLADVNQPPPRNPQQPWQQGPMPQRAPGTPPPAGGFPHQGHLQPPQQHPGMSLPDGQRIGHSAPSPQPSGTLIIASILTAGISLGGALLQSVMSMKSGFGDGNTTFGALVLAAAVLTLLFGIGGSALAMLRGSRTGRVLVTICCLFYLVNGIVTLIQGNTGSIIQIAIAIPLGILWWLPPTSRGMRARTSRP